MLSEKGRFLRRQIKYNYLQLALGFKRFVLQKNAMQITFGILTVSTTCSVHPEKDKAGPALINEILRAFPDGKVTFKHIVTDNKNDIIEVLNNVANEGLCDVLFTVGGTGFAASDVTPEATKAVVEKEATGITYALISKSLAVTEMAMLSRLTSGIKKKTLIINFPGSTKAAVECFGFIQKCLPHAVALIQEQDYEVKMEHSKIQGESKVKIQTGASRMRKSPYPLLDVEEAFALALEAAIPLDETEEIPIEDALCRVLTEDIRAARPIPPFAASTKDGYACRAADGGGVKLVRASAAAGDAPCTEPLRPGEVIRISTGAAIPAGADAVVQVEDTTLASVAGDDEASINIFVTPKVGQDIRQIGSDVQADAVVLQKYTQITPAYIGVLAMLGLNKVLVNRRPLVGIISTGNELVPPKGPLQPGLIYDSNKVTLLTLLKKYGYEAEDCGIARDTPNSVKSILERAFESNDFIVSSGGVSMSEYDLLKQVLVEDFNAIIHFGRINMKPGKPTVFATLFYKDKKKLIFALSGNPVSCCVTSILFVVPILRHLENYTTFTGWPKINVVLEHDIRNNDPRPEYVRLTVSQNAEHNLVASSTGNQISSRLNSMVDANALLLVSGKSVVNKGEVITCFLFDQIV